MKDPLEQYIDQNRSQLDLDQPQPEAWENIHEALHPKAGKKAGSPWGLIFLIGSAAASLLIIFTVFQYEDQEELAGLNPGEKPTKEKTAKALAGDSINKESIKALDSEGRPMEEKKPGEFEYEWQVDSTKIPVAPLSPGIYTVTVTDMNGSEVQNPSWAGLGYAVPSQIQTAVPFLDIAPDSRAGNSTTYSLTTPDVGAEFFNGSYDFSHDLSTYYSYDQINQKSLEGWQSAGTTVDQPGFQTIFGSNATTESEPQYDLQGRGLSYSDGDGRIDGTTLGGAGVYSYQWSYGKGGKKTPMFGFFAPQGDMGTFRSQRSDLSKSGAEVLPFERTSEEQYTPINENQFLQVAQTPLSTFSIDVDGAGYSNMRRFLNNDQLPPPDAVKLEEMINYFHYDLPEPASEHPFSITTEAATCPWNTEHQLVQISLKGQSIDKSEMPANNLVFLIDVSGSMDSYDKLALLKKGFNLLIDELREEDRVSIVVYAGAAGLVLPPTSGINKKKIIGALDQLNAGGSTAGGEGIELAYKIAKKNFKSNGNNRVILATDGDFNVGISDDDALVRLIEEKRETGIFLSVMGFGTGNLQDGKMEKIADNGNGNYSYIDNILEAKKVLVTEMGGTLLTIAKDVKLQVEFNPLKVAHYRLIGYENRLLAAKDFDDDTKDAGELGSGHTVSALYEIIPTGSASAKDPGLKYQSLHVVDSSKYADELLTVKFRYKAPDEDKSKLITKVLPSDLNAQPSENFRFASAVAEFGLVLRNSAFKGNANLEKVLERAQKAKGDDLYGYRADFIQLVEKASLLLKERDQNGD